VTLRNGACEITLVVKVSKVKRSQSSTGRIAALPASRNPYSNSVKSPFDYSEKRTVTSTKRPVAVRVSGFGGSGRAGPGRGRRSRDEGPCVVHRAPADGNPRSGPVLGKVYWRSLEGNRRPKGIGLVRALEPRRSTAVLKSSYERVAYRGSSGLSASTVGPTRFHTESLLPGSQRAAFQTSQAECDVGSAIGLGSLHCRHLARITRFRSRFGCKA
jgi:hypothetical protein